ncbi:MAG TPA: EAL domain-containing protein, partial [Acidobacteriaceae bacterium]
SRYDPRATAAHRVHLRGRVTLQWLGARLCIRDGTHGMCAQTDERTAMPLGAMVDILGFVATGEASPTLTDAVFRLAGPAEPTTAERITADPASLLQHDAGLVEVDGQLIGRDPAAADTTLMLASGKLIVAVLLPRGAANHEIDALRNGSRLRVTGICSVEMDADRSARTGGFPVAKSFRILLRSPQDVILVVAPSWWTPTHGLIVVASILAGMICVLLWNLGLRRRVEQQTHLISQSEKRFKHMAQHDALTGLPTRSVLHERLGEALAHSRESKITLGLLMLDIDNFKLINDLLGHDAGDETLRIAAKRLSRAVRETDTVARMGGDEFVVLFPDLGSEFQVEAIASKIVEAMSQPIRIGDRDVPVSASVGICTACDTSDDVDAMLKSADTALYHAKAQGRNCFQTFTSDMAKDTIAKLQLQAGLARAIEQNELRLHYQPLYSFATGRVEGFEALLRWQSRELGLVMPSTFIPIAEASGSIVPIGEWVLREACRELGALERQLGRTFLLSVNLSPRQCHAPGLPQTIASALADHQRLPGSVEFEITEGMMMTDSARTQSALAELRDSGLQLAIDDFGTGFSSLSYITRFSIDRIKIDKSFIQNCTTDKNSVAVVRAILAMAHGLSIQVVAEGVETAEQFRLLECEGCDTAQGYHLSRPIPASAIPALLESLEKPQAKARERITRKVAAGSRVVRTQAAGSGEKQSAPVDASLCGQAESRSARLPREERHPISSPLA